MSKDIIYREDAIKAIEELPNAYNGWPDAYDKAYIISTLEEVPKADRRQGEWIPCSERLPSEGELVLVSNPYISGVGYYRNRHWYIANNVSWDAWSITDVVAWMPLPKPYREREGE